MKKRSSVRRRTEAAAAAARSGGRFPQAGDLRSPEEDQSMIRKTAENGEGEVDEESEEAEAGLRRPRKVLDPKKP